MRVPQFTAKHLHAATDSNDFSAISEVSEQISVPAVLPEPKEVSVYILAARQDDQVRCRRGTGAGRGGPARVASARRAAPAGRAAPGTDTSGPRLAGRRL